MKRFLLVKRSLSIRCLIATVWLFQSALAMGQATNTPTTPALAAATVTAPESHVLEVAGSLTLSKSGSGQWIPSKPGDILHIGDRVQTGPRSRAALQFSDRSILRLSENTTLVIQPPRNQEKRRFGLLQGLLYFLNRERPSEIEFETPVSTGAIRGTEFSLDQPANGEPTRLLLYDGRVDLTSAGGTVSMSSGEQADVVAGQAPRKSPLLLARRSLQWALYYPAVLIPADLSLDANDTAALAEVLKLYGAGEFIEAQKAIQLIAPARRPGVETLRAALELVSGRVDAAELQLGTLPQGAPGVVALRELIAVVRDEAEVASGAALHVPTNSSEWMARSYTLQGQFKLGAALDAATRATQLSPSSGLAWARRAELEFALNRPTEFERSLGQSLEQAPRLATAHVLRGYQWLANHRSHAALRSFEEALQWDASLGSAWLGLGEARLALGERDAALAAFQTAAALEPLRSLHRSYLAKAFSQRGEKELARKELRLASQTDPADPTPPFYKALDAWQDSRPNDAVDELTRSVQLNDNRRLFRSRLTLDRDLSIRQANLAALYRDAGLPEVALQSASLAIAEDYSNFSAHQFMARSLQDREDPYRTDLKLEAARQNEFTLAALLAPAGASGLSQLALQPEHVEWFAPKPISASARVEYRSSGDWQREASVYGGLDGLSYAVDVSSARIHGESPNDAWERDDVVVQLKQRVTNMDAVWLQLGWTEGDQGDLARRVDPASAIREFHVHEEQLPNLRLGWQHEWSPENQTLLLLGRLEASLQLTNPQPSTLFVRQTAGIPTAISTAPFFHEHVDEAYIVHAAELQHLWHPSQHQIVLGGRIQHGDLERDSVLARDLSGPLPPQHLEESMDRVGGYLYDTWNPIQSLHLIAGLSYDHIAVPLNGQTTPTTEGRRERDQISPKVGLIYSPWSQGVLRMAWTRSLGGYLFDQNLLIEPAQIAGFPQTFRSLLPDSLGGTVPASRFDTAQIRFDQEFVSKTHLGLEASQLESTGERVVGTLVNSIPLPVPNSPSRTAESIEFRERNLQLDAVQRWGEGFSFGIRYRLSEATWDRDFPELPAGLPGLDALRGREQAVMSHLNLTAQYEHRTGYFARWESEMWIQHTGGVRAAADDESLWQHHAWVGRRFLARRAEIRLGLLNLAGADYRLNPLNDYGRPTRNRTAVVSVRVEF